MLEAFIDEMRELGFTDAQVNMNYNSYGGGSWYLEFQDNRTEKWRCVSGEGDTLEKAIAAVRLDQQETRGE